MKNINDYKELLNEELLNLESELKTVGRKNPSNPSDWEATGNALDVDRADETEVADGIEEFEINTGILDQLEKRLNEVRSALEKIELGTFGKCDVCQNEIEEDRLEVNPAAKTCKLHMK